MRVLKTHEEMFSNRTQVDRHVHQLLLKVGSRERNAHGFQIAKLYLEVQEFEKARQYLNFFLSLKKDYVPAFCLLGQINESLNDVDGAVQAYVDAFELDHSNKQLILKICDLVWKFNLPVEVYQKYINLGQLSFESHSTIKGLVDLLSKTTGSINSSEKIVNISQCIETLKNKISQQNYNDGFNFCIETINTIPAIDRAGWFNLVMDFVARTESCKHTTWYPDVLYLRCFALMELLRLTAHTACLSDLYEILVDLDQQILVISRANQPVLNDNFGHYLVSEMTVRIFFYIGVFLERMQKKMKSNSVFTKAAKECFRRVTSVQYEAMDYAKIFEKRVWDQLYSDSLSLRLQAICLTIYNDSSVIESCSADKKKDWKQILSASLEKCNLIKANLNPFVYILETRDDIIDSSFDEAMVEQFYKKILTHRPDDLNIIIWFLLQSIHETTTNSIDRAFTTNRLSYILMTMSHMFSKFPFFKDPLPGSHLYNSTCQTTTYTVCQLDVLVFLVSLAVAYLTRHVSSPESSSAYYNKHNTTNLSINSHSPLFWPSVPLCLINARLLPSGAQRRCWIELLAKVAEMKNVKNVAQPEMLNFISQLRFSSVDLVNSGGKKTPSARLVIRVANALSLLGLQLPTSFSFEQKSDLYAWSAGLWETGLSMLHQTAPQSALSIPIDRFKQQQSRGACDESSILFPSELTCDWWLGTHTDSLTSLASQDAVWFSTGWQWLANWNLDTVKTNPTHVSRLVHLLRSQRDNVCDLGCALLAGRLVNRVMSDNDGLTSMGSLATITLTLLNSTLTVHKDNEEDVTLSKAICTEIELLQTFLHPSQIASKPSLLRTGFESTCSPLRFNNNSQQEPNTVNSSFVETMRSSNLNGNGRPSGYSMSHINSPHRNSGLFPSLSRQQDGVVSAGLDGVESQHARSTDSNTNCMPDGQTKLMSQMFDQWLPAFTDFSRQMAEASSELSRSRMHNEQLTKLLTDTRTQLDCLRDEFEKTKATQQKQEQKTTSTTGERIDSNLKECQVLQTSLQEVAASLREFRQWLPAVMSSSVNNTLQTWLTTSFNPIVAAASMSHVPPTAPPVPNWPPATYQPELFMAAAADGGQQAAQLALVMNALQQSQRIPPSSLLSVSPPTYPTINMASTVAPQLSNQGMFFGADMTKHTSLLTTSVPVSVPSVTPVSVAESVQPQLQPSQTHKPFDFCRSTTLTVKEPTNSVFHTPVISPQKPLFNFQPFKNEVSHKQESAAAAPTTQPSFLKLHESPSTLKFPVLPFSTPKLDTTSLKSAQLNAGDDEIGIATVTEDERPEAYIPKVEFAPLVEKLPDLVTASTGEEHETPVFCQRARLFRFDKSSNEWKARGVGELKVLEDTSEVKFRIVMRRDQIMKLCANHYIAPGINFSRHPQDIKACMWNARDFANIDGDTASLNGTDELLMVQFKTDVIANEFEQIVTESLAKVEKNLSKSSAVKQVMEMENKHAPIMLLSGPKAGSWDCDGCSLQVSPDLTKCPACRTVKPGTEKSATTASVSSIFNTSTPTTDSQKTFTFGLFSIPTVTSGLDKLKAKEGSWDCGACALQVNPDEVICPACQTPKPGIEKPVTSGAVSSMFKTSTPTMVSPKTILFGIPTISKVASSLENEKTKHGSWNCGSCALQVDLDEIICHGCNTSKPGTEKPINGASMSVFKAVVPNNALLKNIPFGTASGLPNTTFSFGLTTTQSKSLFRTSNTISPTPTDNSTKLAGTFASLNFGVGSAQVKPNFSFNFNPTPTTKLNKIPTSSPIQSLMKKSDIDLDEDDDEVEQVHQSQLNFTPIIEKLPDQILVQTGEEDEEIVFEARAKLYRYLNVDGWKERGLGQLKLLRTPSTKKVRVVMRREQVLKVCCNHVITGAMKLEPQSGSTDIPRWIWWGVDFAEEAEGVQETFSVRFKNVEDSQNFHNAFMEAVNVANGGKSTYISLNETTSKVEVPETVEISSDEDDLVIVDQSPLSPDQVSRARALQLPDNFYAFETHPKSRQRHREEMTSEEEAAEDLLLDAAVGVAEVSASNSSMGVIGLSNTLEKSSLIEDDEKKIIPMGMDRLKAKTGSWDCATCVLQVDADLDKCPACQTDRTTEATEKQIIEKKNEEAAPLFPVNKPGMVDFGSLCSSNEKSSTNVHTSWSLDSSAGQQRVWPGAGKTLFGKSSTPLSYSSVAATSIGDDQSSEVSESDPDPHFEPIFALPPIIEANTGEEDEICLFLRRCRLYKIVNGAWKERGIGEMKVMVQPKTPAPEHLNNREALSPDTDVGGVNYARLLMRRDQVLKICANHTISQEVPEFTPLQTSETSLCWVAQDYSEELEGEIMKLAIRFKTKQDVKDFLDSITRARTMLKKE